MDNILNDIRDLLLNLVDEIILCGRMSFFNSYIRNVYFNV